MVSWKKRTEILKNQSVSDALDLVASAWDRRRMMWVQWLLVKLSTDIHDGEHPGGNLLNGANVQIDVEEVEPEMGWHTYEIKARVVINERVDGEKPDHRYV